MKKQEVTFKTEVTAVVPEPKVGDIPPITVTTMEQMTTTIISGQVGAASVRLYGLGRISHRNVEVLHR